MISFLLSQANEHPMPQPAGTTDFMELFLNDVLKINLWHNVANLSFPQFAKSLNDYHELWGPPDWKPTDESILINDLPKAYAALSAAKSSGNQT